MSFPALPYLTLPGFSLDTPDCDYPSEDNVRDGVEYADGAMTGNIVLPDEEDVFVNIGYGSNGTELIGSLTVPIAPTPVSPTPGANPFASIAIAIYNRLVTVLGIAPMCVKLVANDRYKITITEPLFIYCQFFGVTKPRDPALEYTDAGAGRLARPVARRLRVYVYTRSGADIYGDDTIALTGANSSQTIATPPTMPGQFIAEELIFNALDDWQPLSGDVPPVGLTIGPLHVLDSSEEPERKAEDDEGLLRSCLDFEVVYLSAIDPTDPAQQAS